MVFGSEKVGGPGRGRGRVGGRRLGPHGSWPGPPGPARQLGAAGCGHEATAEPTVVDITVSWTTLDMSREEEVKVDLKDTIGRRSVLKAGVVSFAGMSGAASAASQEKKPGMIDPEAGVTAPEDLMKEHGVLNRCLLIYDEATRRLRDKAPVAPDAFSRTAELIRTFVEGYHERNEEQYIFPVFEKHGTLVDLVRTLKTQHLAGREVTARILRLSTPEQFRSQERRTQLMASCQSFIRMYRPHKSREDTVLFPALRTLLRPDQVEALGDRMEEDELKVLGAEGFEKSVDKVASIEKALGIYDLEQFTPKA
jgi:hemerythrin-like domain-containing protein